MATFAEVLRLKKRMAKQLLKQSGVYGVGVGYKNPNKPKEGACLVVYSSGRAAARLGKQPRSTQSGKRKEIPMRFVHTPKFRLRASASAAQYTRRIRPVRAGYSIGTSSGSGTAGLIVRRVGSSRLYALSNNHVLNLNNSTGYTATYQPGGADSPSSRDRIGRLDRFVQLRRSGNLIDGAISVPLRSSLLTPQYARVGIVPGHVTAYRIGERLKKVGRTSGYVNGWVESVNTDVRVDYGDFGGLGTVQFDNVTVIRGNNPVSQPGDSGSVWLRRSDNYAAAINFAGTSDGRTSIAYPVEWFMQAFRMRVARPGGVGQVKRVNGRGSQYTRPLTLRQLRRISVLQARSR
jgi:hypothetical protein